MEDNEERLVGTFISASVESASQLPFIIRHRNGSEHQIISQLHNLFVFPFASGKSVLAEKIPNSLLSLSHTEPAIVGSISREGTLIRSDLINSANKVYVMDECHRLNKKGMDAMLSLLESGYYDRSLGFGLRSPVNEGNFKKLGWEINSRKSLNNIALKVRFSCIGFCERVTKSMHGAFLSRFAIFNVVLDDKDIFKLMRGEGILKAGNVKGKYKVMKKPVEFDNYDDFVDEYEELVMSKGLNRLFNGMEKGYMTRVGGNIAKLAVHFTRVEGKAIVEPKHYRKALKFAPLLIRNLKEIYLTPSDYKVYDAYFIQGKKQSKVAEELGISEAYVSKIVKFLKVQSFITSNSEQTDEENTKEK